MIDPKDILNYNRLSPAQKKALEKTMQEDELSYLSSLAFEKFKVTSSETEQINQLIDKKIRNGHSPFYTVLISLLSGLMIGVSIFFILFNKSKTHPSVYQPIEETLLTKTLDNTVTRTDTMFNLNQKNKTPFTEHYDSKSVSVEAIRQVETYDLLSAKTITLDTRETQQDEEQELLFIPNAPVIFISNLKITNYRIYYFKQNQFVNLSINSGVAAQYENVTADPESMALNKSDSYMAHKIIQRAMFSFDRKDYTECINELNLLITFNPDDANAQFYLGMCFYLTNRFSLAQPYFQKNRMNENNIFHQESDFYQAMCLLNLKQTEEAIKQFELIIKNKGFYSDRAKEILLKLN